MKPIYSALLPTAILFFTTHATLHASEIDERIETSFTKSKVLATI